MDKVTVIVLGQMGVGKTTFLTTAKEGHAPRQPIYPTIGVENITFHFRDICMRCWDASGNKRFEQIVPMFIRNCDAAIYIFRPEDSSTIQDALTLYNVAQTVPDPPKVHIFIANTPRPLSFIDRKQFPSDIVLAGNFTQREEVEHILNTILEKTFFSPHRDLTYSSHSLNRIQIRQCCGIQ